MAPPRLGCTARVPACRSIVYLTFADDVILLATTRRQLTAMLNELIEAVQRVGLEIHHGKTKIIVKSFARTAGLTKVRVG